jgi:hypothetical protein
MNLFLIMLDGYIEDLLPSQRKILADNMKRCLPKSSHVFIQFRSPKIEMLHASAPKFPHKLTVNNVHALKFCMLLLYIDKPRLAYNVIHYFRCTTLALFDP